MTIKEAVSSLDAYFRNGLGENAPIAVVTANDKLRVYHSRRSYLPIIPPSDWEGFQVEYVASNTITEATNSLRDYVGYTLGNNLEIRIDSDEYSDVISVYYKQGLDLTDTIPNKWENYFVELREVVAFV